MYKAGGVSGEASDRNYTINYSKERYAALWTAYTLTASDITGGQSGSKKWTYNNDVFNGNYQVGVTGESNSYPSNYQNASLYSRGHQIPNADRTSSTKANEQTYFVTNQTPQIANGFNGSIWGELERAARAFVVTDSNYSNFSQTDVLYVITGPCYGKKGTSETPDYLVASSNITPSQVPIPKYFWKVLLKVKKDSNGNVTSASTVGFWYEHKEYASGTSFYNSTYVKSVDQIEAWTGFDLFTNLPGTQTSGIEQSAESNSSWTAFRDF